MAGSFGGFSSLAGAPQGLQQAYMRDPRLRLAQQLQLQGADTSPVQHWTQGAARLAQALAGNFVQDRADGEYKKQADQYQADIGALYAPVMQPGAGGAGPRPDAQMRAPNVNELQQRMASMQSPYALEMARPMLQSAMERQAAMEAEARKPFNLRPGEQRMDASGRVIAANPVATKPENRFMNVAGVGLVDTSGETPRVALPANREQTPYQVITTADGIYAIDPRNPSGPRVRLGDKPDRNEGEVWEPDPQNPAVQRNRLTGERKAIPGAEKETERRDQAASTVVDLNRMIDSAQSLLAHPGRKTATGFSSVFNFVPGTDAYDFKAQLETLRAQVFLPEVQKMVGMGALSNAEGEKIAAAFAALDPGMSEAAFERSLRDALGRMQEARTRFEQRAGGGRLSQQGGGVTVGGAAPTVRTWNPATGKLE